MRSVPAFFCRKTIGCHACALARMLTKKVLAVYPGALQVPHVSEPQSPSVCAAAGSSAFEGEPLHP